MLHSQSSEGTTANNPAPSRMGVTQSFYFPVHQPSQGLPPIHSQQAHHHPYAPQHPHALQQQNLYPQQQVPQQLPAVYQLQPPYPQQAAPLSQSHAPHVMQGFNTPQISMVVSPPTTEQTIGKMRADLEQSKRENAALNARLKNLNNNYNLLYQRNLQILAESQSVYATLQQERAQHNTVVQEKETLASLLKQSTAQNRELIEEIQKQHVSRHDQKIEIAALRATKEVSASHAKIQAAQDKTKIEDLEKRLALAQAEIIKLKSEKLTSAQPNDALNTEPDESTNDSHQGEAVRTLTLLRTARDEKEFTAMREKFLNFVVPEQSSSSAPVPTEQSTTTKKPSAK